MFFGGTNFILISSLATKFSFSIFKNEEFRWYMTVIALFTIIVTIALPFIGAGRADEETLRKALFQVVSAITSTGFSTANLVAWGPFYWFIFLLMILFCGCESSTSGGMKISRLLVLVKNSQLAFKRQVHPNALYMVKINNSALPNHLIFRVGAFVFLYLTISMISAILLSLSGLNFAESISVSLSSISNYGYGLGSYGPGSNFASLPHFAKYLLTFLMLVGRLEIFTVLSLFIPGFWKR